MKLLPLTKGFFAMVDDADFELVNQYRWYYTGGYAARKATINLQGRKRGTCKQKQKTLYLARFLMGEPIGMNVDHKNLNPLDNQRHNLRICTGQQNKQNVAKYKGVSWSKAAKKWHSGIRINNVSTNLGHYTEERFAAEAYNNVAKLVQGEFARLNTF